MPRPPPRSRAAPTPTLETRVPDCPGPWPYRPPSSHRPYRLKATVRGSRSEEHTSELQSHSDLVCRLLLEKKKKTKQRTLILKQREGYSREEQIAFLELHTTADVY